MKQFPEFAARNLIVQSVNNMLRSWGKITNYHLAMNKLSLAMNIPYMYIILYIYMYQKMIVN